MAIRILTTRRDFGSPAPGRPPSAGSWPWPGLAARHNPVAVFAGAVLGLWLIAALAVNLGAKSLDLIPMAWVRRVTAAILLALGINTALTALVR